MMELEGNVGCMYFLRWENMVDDNITTELLWCSNLDIALEDMDEEELEETLEYIFKDNYGRVVRNVDDWDAYYQHPEGAYYNMGW